MPRVNENTLYSIRVTKRQIESIKMLLNRRMQAYSKLIDEQKNKLKEDHIATDEIMLTQLIAVRLDYKELFEKVDSKLEEILYPGMKEVLRQISENEKDCDNCKWRNPRVCKTCNTKENYV